MERTAAVNCYLLAFLVLALPAAVLISCTDRLQLHAMIHSGHLGVADEFFRYFTHLGDGLVPTFLAIGLLLFHGMRGFLMMGLSCGLGAIIVQVMKRVFFPEMDRPVTFQEEMPGMHWVADLVLNNHYTFPSGHAAAAFGMCTALVVIIARRRWALPLLLFATAIAYSRVHLSQHFTEDVLAGAIIGTVSAYGIHRWIHGTHAPAWTRLGPLLPMARSSEK